MTKVYFYNSQSESREIGGANNKEEVAQIISKFLKEKNYKSYYTRTWVREGKKWYDVGSHSEFFWHNIFEEV